MKGGISKSRFLDASIGNFRASKTGRHRDIRVSYCGCSNAAGFGCAQLPIEFSFSDGGAGQFGSINAGKFVGINDERIL